MRLHVVGSKGAGGPYWRFARRCSDESRLLLLPPPPLQAQLINYDNVSDLAVLKVDSEEPLPHVKLGGQALPLLQRTPGVSSAKHPWCLFCSSPLVSLLQCTPELQAAGPLGSG
jgi:hypothetical protein